MPKFSAKSAGVAAFLAAGILGSAAVPANAFVAPAPAPAQAVSQTSYTNGVAPDAPGLGRFIMPTQSTQNTVTTNTVSTHSTNSPAPLAGTHIEQLKQTVNTEALSPERATIVEDALAGQGGKYVWGGKTFKNWDCSGFVAYVFKQNNINLTAYTYAMKNEVKKVTNPQPGDIVFTNNYSHVGIYLGEGKMISALNPEQGTIITDVDGGGYMPVDGFYSAL